MGVATEPIGKCLYVYGGGWNEEDTAAGVEALSYGISPVWVDFYNKNNLLHLLDKIFLKELLFMKNTKDSIREKANGNAQYRGDNGGRCGNYHSNPSVRS